MLDSISLTNLILAEVIFALLLVVGILLFVLRRERKAHRSLLAETRPRAGALKRDKTELGQAEAERPGEAVDPIAQYLEQCQKSAQNRYYKITDARHPRLAPELPFNAKIAALRYLYCSAEVEAYKQRKEARDVWILMEKQLYDIARWIVEREAAKPDKRLTNQVKLLQQRVESLRPFEHQTRHLEHKLELSKIKQQRLEEFHQESLATIKKLRHINRTLSLTGDSSSQASRLGKQESVVNLPDSRQLNSAWQESIDELAAQSRVLNRELSRGLRDLSAKQKAGGNTQELESLVEQMERELVASDRHIKLLKKQLTQTEQRAATVFGAHRPLAPHTAEAQPSIKEPLQIIVRSRSEAAPVASVKAPEPSPYPVKEIAQLRANNRDQRSLIVNLERQLGKLQETLVSTDAGPEKDAKLAEVIRLEQLIREYEHCIESLESEIDRLQQRLEQQSSDEARAEASKELGEASEDFERLTREIQESMAQKLRNNLAHSFALAALKAESIEELAKSLVETLEEAEMVVGFYLQSSLGKAEFFKGDQFTAPERKLVKKPTIAAPVAYLNEGILFSSDQMHLLLKNPPDGDLELAEAETLLQELVDLTSAQIRHLELSRQAEQQKRALENWSDTTRETVVSLEISYAYQAEEVMRQVQSLTEELQHISANLKMSPASRTVLDNALSECRQHIVQVFSAGEVLDQHCSKLLEHLDQLPRPQH